MDTLAAGALFEARRRGIDVPGRLGIAGFGDFALAQPAGLDMTTMRIAGRNIGAEAGAMLVKRIAGETPEQAVFDVGYEVVRRSSA
ncbi:substrate-binding domain-containing protein [Methylopila sp. 73B]|uniref:substrate-binding domain-containing protein n=1 Tax=Methylopila sp. 73B TaxID=1120792 RepID=UPI00036E2171|nr:substrate-binding domain-containing protein [Methylopila sp. 73B]